MGLDSTCGRGRTWERHVEGGLPQHARTAPGDRERLAGRATPGGGGRGLGEWGRTLGTRGVPWDRGEPMTMNWNGTRTATATAPERISRVLAQVTSAGGAVLVAVAGLTTVSCLVLGALVVRARDGVGSWVPVGIGILAALVVCALAIDRHRLTRDLARAPRSGGATVLVTTDPEGSTTLHAPGVPHAPGADWHRARTEFDMRRPTRLPRVEAAQRAARTWVGDTTTSPWLERDVRPTVALFLATALVIPVTATTAIASTLVLLTS